MSSQVEKQARTSPPYPDIKRNTTLLIMWDEWLATSNVKVHIKKTIMPLGIHQTNWGAAYQHTVAVQLQKLFYWQFTKQVWIPLLASAN